ncbi:hypothetical protein [Gemmata palustris]|uniref:hypothetical protein n=1 Tax=Gemmata palustris TaxID=2822762 RepID=UPI001FEA5D8D|nr:hypothetical protein [Gemmata palustris]
MLFRGRSFNPWLWAVVIAGLSVAQGAAQPPSPLDLVRGLRENGQVDLAMEYLKQFEGKPLAGADKGAFLLERAKCLLEVSEYEPDEGTRLGMIAEAKEGLNTFVQDYPDHPRAVEGLLSVAKLTSLDAKEILSRARKMDVPPPSDDADERQAREQAQHKQAKEAEKARPLFQLASSRFASASAKLKARLDDPALDPGAKKGLENEAFEAELASGINQFSIAETFMPEEILDGPQKEQRNKFLEQARSKFDKLDQGPPTSRSVWVARAWVAEVIYEQNDFGTATTKVGNILRATAPEAEDGKRLARFFQLRRNVRAALAERVAAKITTSENEMRRWLTEFGRAQKPTPEVYAVRYYLARSLHFQADVATPQPKPPAVLAIGAAARKQLEEAEKLYRGLAQTDHEYTARAARYRTAVVRKLLGTADQNPLSYESFEKAQMASLIQLSNLVSAESKEAKLGADPKADPKKVEEAKSEARSARHRVIALLERARELATPQDSLADVTDVQLRLIYFYQQNEQFYQAAVLGDFVARTVKTTGGKSALAGLLGLNGYLTASRVIKAEERDALAAARQCDRDRAVALARFLDEKFPNDTATDSARHQLAGLLTDDKKYMEAFDVLVKVRPSYAQLTNARLLEGFVVSQLVVPLDSKLSKDDKARLFRRATSDLAKIPQPAPVATVDEVRSYLSARCRLAAMMLAQDRADGETERTNAGFNQALDLAGKILAEVPAFECMVGEEKKLNLDGQEMHLLALDTYTRALYLRARAMTANNQFEGALALVKPVLDQVQAGGPLFTGEMKTWAAGAGNPEPEAKSKARSAQLAANIDKNRVDVILAAFRVQVRQGKAAEASKLLDLMVRAGGTVDESLPLLEPVGRELAALMVTRQKEGKAEEAKNLGAGLGVLLEKIRAVKTLPVPSLLFVGQTLQSIGKNAEALETLKKVPAPTYPDWDKKKPEEFPEADRGKVLNQVRDHALAQHSIAKAQIELKQFAEAEKLLKGVVGTPDKPGWGANRLYFRKALAELFEAKGAAEPDPKKANAEWGQAVREWGAQVGMQRNRLSNPPKDATPDQLAQFRNAFADAFFDVQRCTVTANQQLQKSQPDKLQKTYDDVGKRLTEMEKQIVAADWQPEVQNRYFEFIKANPPLLNAYKASGGKLFLEKMPPRP